MKRVFGTREWASHNRNCQKGCEHGCWYCYAAASHKGQDFNVPHAQKEPPETIKKVKGHIMFPTRQDELRREQTHQEWRAQEREGCG